MKTIFLDHTSLLRAINTAARAEGVIEIIEQNKLLNICEVDDKALAALKEEGVVFTGGDDTKKKAPVEKKKKLTSSTK